MSLGRTKHLTPPRSGCGCAINRTLPPTPVTPNHRRWRLSPQSEGDFEHATILNVVDAPKCPRTNAGVVLRERPWRSSLAAASARWPDLASGRRRKRPMRRGT